MTPPRTALTARVLWSKPLGSPSRGPFRRSNKNSQGPEVGGKLAAAETKPKTTTNTLAALNQRRDSSFFIGYLFLPKVLMAPPNRPATIAVPGGRGFLLLVLDIQLLIFP